VLGAAKELIKCSLQDGFNGGNARYIRSFPRYRTLSILETTVPDPERRGRGGNVYVQFAPNPNPIASNVRHKRSVMPEIQRITESPLAVV
jgi:hypothetical protein